MEIAIRWGSASQPADSLEQLLVRGMRVHRCRQRTHVPGEPLRQEQVPAGPVDVGHGGVVGHPEECGGCPQRRLGPETSSLARL